MRKNEEVEGGIRMNEGGEGGMRRNEGVDFLMFMSEKL